MTPDTIDVVLVTWPNHPRRMEYLRRVWDSIQENMTASRHHIRWLCSAESERDPNCCWCGDALEALCDRYGIELHWREGAASLGANMNAAVRLCSAPTYVLHQDDFELLSPLDLSQVAEFMLRHPEVSVHRISYFTDAVNGTKFCREIEPGFRQVDIDGTWPIGDDPQMRRQDFVERHGEFIEGGRHGCSEGDMLFRLVRQRAVISAGMRSYYGHIGGVASVPESQEYRERAERRSQP